MDAAGGAVAGAVDDGDGVLSEDDCKLENGQLDAKTCALVFDQVYTDGAVTHWRAEYDRETDALVRGMWTGACNGSFGGVRTHTRTSQ